MYLIRVVFPTPGGPITNIDPPLTTRSRIISADTAGQAYYLRLPIPDGADPVQRVVDSGSIVLGELSDLQQRPNLQMGKTEPLPLVGLKLVILMGTKSILR
jgi:hypothetical protein